MEALLFQLQEFACYILFVEVVRDRNIDKQKFYALASFILFQGKQCIRAFKGFEM